MLPRHLQVGAEHNEASATNSAATATITGKSNMRFYITAFSLSASAAPAAAVQAEIRSGSNVLMTFDIPAAAFSPIFVNVQHPLRCNAGEAPVVNLPALGAAVVGSASVHGYFSHE